MFKRKRNIPPSDDVADEQPKYRGTARKRGKLSPSDDMADQPSTTPPPPRRTFKLYEFYNFGSDSHNFVFVQRESNTKALARFERNLQKEESAGYSGPRFHSRVYAEQDLENIKKSCLELLKAFSGTSDNVGFDVIRGKIYVQSRGSKDAYEWFGDTFGGKRSEWKRGFRVESDEHECLM